nr:hypothetical protein Iba_chr04aCG0270 [Ipomoea batatas]GMC81123.1 hypothetical protein Iba_chr04bCG1030 [Ipomoea batatas]GMC83422.1 hypothetical protein Iba_chr04cCG1930 [Ipomoea batatas]GMC85367.1 hypothetical protein Iba_chr04dCG0740 [Ipomoea batatas]GMC87532.1 hypothetical protein Iba_chr04eCG1400 [Ipomoea batatas]
MQLESKPRDSGNRSLGNSKLFSNSLVGALEVQNMLEQMNLNSTSIRNWKNFTYPLVLPSISKGILSVVLRITLLQGPNKLR